MLILETTAKFLPEKTYSFEVLLRELLGLDYQIRVVERPGYLLRLPHGATLFLEDHFFDRVPEGDYLHPINLPDQVTNFAPPFEQGEQLTAIYGNPQFEVEENSIRSGLDVFASTFFMLTRWEEYVLPERDAHGRFLAKNALAFKAGFLERPVVNEYADWLWQLLVRLGWAGPRVERPYRLQLSYDVDYPLLWNSPVDRLRTLGGSLFKRKQPQETLYWLKNQIFRQQDPYDTFETFMELAEQNGRPAHFNFLGERSESSDAFYVLEQPFIRDLMQKIVRRGHVIGFHPSYEAYDDHKAFERELASVRRVSGQTVTTGRHHFLRFAAPHTWQRWADAGLDWDSSVGYSEAIGFRAGICDTYPVFNFLTRQPLALREKPLIAMDVTLALYQQFTPEQALEKLEQLRRTVRRHRGEFTLLWHNSSWNTYFWAAWQAVYRSFVADAAA